MALTEKQVEQYHRDGYILVEDVFTSDELATMKREVRSVLERIERESPGATRSGVYVGLAIASELFRGIHADPRLVDVLVQLIGPDVEFWSDKAVFKSASVDYASPWHQDWWYWEGATKTSIWIALDDATPENGCLKMIPGSHHAVCCKAEGIADDKFINRMEEGAIDETKSVVLPVRAGGVVFFHDLTLHASLPNVSGKDRLALISTYRNAAVPDLHYDFAAGAFMVAGERKAVQAPAPVG